jgi:hypothetical protein
MELEEVLLRRQVLLQQEIEILLVNDSAESAMSVT